MVTRLNSVHCSWLLNASDLAIIPWISVAHYSCSAQGVAKWSTNRNKRASWVLKCQRLRPAIFLGAGDFMLCDSCCQPRHQQLCARLLSMKYKMAQFLECIIYHKIAFADHCHDWWVSRFISGYYSDWAHLRLKSREFRWWSTRQAKRVNHAWDIMRCLNHLICKNRGLQETVVCGQVLGNRGCGNDLQKNRGLTSRVYIYMMCVYIYIYMI